MQKQKNSNAANYSGICVMFRAVNTIAANEAIASSDFLKKNKLDKIKNKTVLKQWDSSGNRKIHLAFTN